jgi:hypothetical protein
MACSLTGRHRYLGGTFYLYHQGKRTRLELLYEPPTFNIINLRILSSECICALRMVKGKCKVVPVLN